MPRGKRVNCLMGSEEAAVKIASKSNPLKEDSVESGGGIAGYHRSIRRKWGILLGLAVIVVLFMLISVNAGSSDLSLWEVCRTLLAWERNAPL